jgi:hypothetical protein
MECLRHPGSLFGHLHARSPVRRPQMDPQRDEGRTCNLASPAPVSSQAGRITIAATLPDGPLDKLPAPCTARRHQRCGQGFRHRDTRHAIRRPGAARLVGGREGEGMAAASLPLRHGGLRLQSAQEIAPLAFFFAANVEVHLGLSEAHAGLADVLSAHVFERESPPPDQGVVDYADVHRAVHWGSNWVNDLDAGQEQGRTERPRDPSKLHRTPTDVNDRYRKLRRTLTEQHQRRQTARLLRDVPPAQRAALCSAAGNGSSALFIAVPSSSNLYMPDFQFALALRDRLLLPTVVGTSRHHTDMPKPRVIPNSQGNTRTTGAARRLRYARPLAPSPPTRLQRNPPPQHGH